VARTLLTLDTMKHHGWLVALPVILATSNAYALDQSEHYDITYDACRAGGAPDVFCEQVATATHNVDNEEFFDMAAHGQMRDGQSACEGAHYAAWRVFWLGQRLRPLIQQAAIYPTHNSISGFAKWLGRALHTIQDNCAHSGMPNPQHAWYSIHDFCSGAETSPDAQPEARTCAITETRAVFDAVYSVLADNGATKAELANVRDDSRHRTNLHDGCHYLGDADNWDGEDRRWDNNIVRPFLRKMLVNAITKDNAKFEYVCQNTTEPLLVDYDAPVDVSDGPDGCAIISIVCLGKADGDEEAMLEDGVPPPPDDEGGCSTTHATSGLAMWLGLAFVIGRRRRR
jgi:uncharacterized protein (TIGR03382 family)